MQSYYYSNSQAFLFLILIVLPLIILMKFYKVRKKYPLAILISVVLGMIGCTITFLIGVIPRYGMYQDELSVMNKLMIYFPPAVFIFFMIGAIQKLARDQQKRLVALFGSLLIFIPSIAYFLIKC